MVSSRSHSWAILPALIALPALGLMAPAGAEDSICVECIEVRVGPPTVVRGPFPDELDATFTALRLADGTMRGFSANGATYAIDGSSLFDLGGERRAVLQPGEPGSITDCGRWLTSVVPVGDKVVGFVHQEQACDYDRGQTGKSMAIATSLDGGRSWADLGTVITGTDELKAETVTGEGDCSLVDGRDGYLYAYCLRNSDWQTIVARARPEALTEWRKFFEGYWLEPGLGGRATDIGFVGTGAGYLLEPGWVAAVATDPWFEGLRLSVSADKVTFLDLPEPLLPIDGSDWDRPADTDLSAYATILNPETGGNAVENTFILSYMHVPARQGFESRYLVHHEVSLALRDAPPDVQVGVALTRWIEPERNIYVSSTGPLTGDRLGYRKDAVVAHMLTRAPENAAGIKFAECSRDGPEHLDQLIADEGSCESEGYRRERTAGWLFAAEQPGAVPVYRCVADEAATHFVSGAPDCEGLGRPEFLLGYGLAP
jgi:hypothetical protein